jgi:DNA polymerase bacteriophage-type
MNDFLEIDFETASDIDIGTRGVYIYMQSPNTRPLFASYKLYGGATKRWDASEPCPQEIVDHVISGGTIKAHNAGFERLLWQLILTPRYGWPEAKTEQFACTAATAAALSLPRSLADLGSALGLEIQKDKDGWRLIKKFSIPRPPKDNEEPGLYFNKPDEFPADWQKFKVYCDIDVETEALADHKMVPLRTECQTLYTLSERINDRGIRLDVTSAKAAVELAAKAKELLDREMTIATGGYVTACSQVARLVDWVAAQGVPLDSVAKAEIEELLEADDLPERVRRAIEIRQEAAKTSVTKLTAFLNRVSRDQRIRGAFMFRAAGTGRYSSVGVQLHNMPRPRKEFLDAKLDPGVLFDAIRRGDPDYIKTLYGDKLGRTLWLLSDAIRGFLWAAPGHELIAADYSGIEGAVAAWFCGEDWVVDALFEIIRDPNLPDMYRRTAAGIFGTTTDALSKKDPRRQVGKVSILSLQYQGGVSAFYSMARNYALKLDEIYPFVWESASPERREAATKRYGECLARKEPATQQLSEKAWIAAELVKVGWRAANPAITASWKILDEAIFEAVADPGRVVTALKVKYLVKNGFLWCMLPSGRCLAYATPRVKDIEVPWSDKTQPAEKRETKAAVTVMGVDSQTKKLVRYPLYGGLALENIVQAISLDILENGIVKAEAAGYPVVLHVHDEIVAEVPRGFGDLAEFEKLICELPAWGAGIPLTASGYRSKRYKKD